jgi:hypothetical protein
MVDPRCQSETFLPLLFATRVADIPALGNRKRHSWLGAPTTVSRWSKQAGNVAGESAEIGISAGTPERIIDCDLLKTQKRRLI